MKKIFLFNLDVQTQYAFRGKDDGVEEEREQERGGYAQIMPSAHKEMPQRNPLICTVNNIIRYL